MTPDDPRAVASSVPFWAAGPARAAAPAARPARAQFPPLPGRVALAAIGAGALGALLLPGNALGIGIAATAVAILGAAESARTRPVTGWATALDLGAVALATTAVVSDAGWVLFFSLLAACGLASLSQHGGVTLPDTLRGLVIAAERMVPAPLAVWRPVRSAMSSSTLATTAPAARAIAIALALVVPFAILFLSADRAFSEIANRYLVPDLDGALIPWRLLVLGALTTFTAALVLAGMRRVPQPAAASEPTESEGVEGTADAVTADEPAAAEAEPAVVRRRTLSRLEWLTSLIALDLLFLAFVLVQITSLFPGRSHVIDTAGLSYAEYARSGFFQLLVVGALALVVITAFAVLAQRERPSDRVVLQVLLGLLCVLTLVILVSSWHRMDLYEREFGLTRLRIAVRGSLLWLAAIFLMVMAAGVSWRARWLPRAAVALTTVALLTFALLRPDAVIAEHNVAHYERTGRIDTWYLSQLSADAVPAIATLPIDLRECALEEHRDRLERRDAWPALNLSRRRARDILDATVVAECAPVSSNR